MAQRYSKTEPGRAEIRARVHALTRTARNLLLIIDPSRESSEWVTLVQGASAADLQTLIDAGLIEPHGTGAAVAAPQVTAAEAATPAQAVTPLTYDELYELLPALAKEHLGLMKGYRFALAIEKAAGLPGLQQVAQELITEVEKAKGPGVARAVSRALMLG